MNTALAKRTLEWIRKSGVRELCVCPGARNAPWIQELREHPEGFRVYWFYEERSAAFFALGRIKANEHPVAVLTTSGTAAGELLPATMEAFYSHLPLVLMTADRPERFRGSGAPQAAEQKELFGVYCKTSFDFFTETQVPNEAFSIHSPLHLNVCFEDPKGKSLAPTPPESFRQNPGSLSGFWKETQNPLVIVGQLNPTERPVVEQFLKSWGAPAYLEALSGLRESPELAALRIHVGDRLLSRCKSADYPVDGVLRIGSIPTHRFWRDLEDTELPVASVSALPFSGLGRSSNLFSGSIPQLLSESPPKLSTSSRRLLEKDLELCQGLQAALRSEPDSEPGIFHALSTHIERESRVYLGNSLPIREWDLAATWDSRGLDLHASRGLNGIDGQLSTFLGLCRPETSNWAILGDLTVLYDLAGPWPLAQLAPSTRATLVIINNGGGKIFERMFEAPEFLNSHTLDFKGWAQLWKVPYHQAGSVAEIETQNIETENSKRLRIIELTPDRESTSRFWKRTEELFS